MKCWGRSVCVDCSKITNKVWPQFREQSPHSAGQCEPTSFLENSGETEGHTEKEKEGGAVVKLFWFRKWRGPGSCLDHSVDRSGLFPNIYSWVLFFSKTIKGISISNASSKAIKIISNDRAQDTAACSPTIGGHSPGWSRQCVPVWHECHLWKQQTALKTRAEAPLLWETATDYGIKEVCMGEGSSFLHQEEGRIVQHRLSSKEHLA